MIVADGVPDPDAARNTVEDILPSLASVSSPTTPSKEEDSGLKPYFTSPINAVNPINVVTQSSGNEHVDSLRDKIGHVTEGNSPSLSALQTVQQMDDLSRFPRPPDLPTPSTQHVATAHKTLLHHRSGSVQPVSLESNTEPLNAPQQVLPQGRGKSTKSKDRVSAQDQSRGAEPLFADKISSGNSPSSAHSPFVKNPSANNPSANNPSANNPPANNPFANKTAVNGPSTNHPFTNSPSANDLSGINSPANNPPYTTVLSSAESAPTHSSGYRGPQVVEGSSAHGQSATPVTPSSSEWTGRELKHMASLAPDQAEKYKQRKRKEKARNKDVNTAPVLDVATVQLDDTPHKLYEFVDWAKLLGLDREGVATSYASSDLVILAYQTELAKHLDAAREGSYEKRDWHNQRVRLLEKAREFFSRKVTMHGAVVKDQSEADWKRCLVNFDHERFCFLQYRADFEGRTLRNIPFGYGYTLETTFCPDSGCGTCKGSEQSAAESATARILPVDQRDYPQYMTAVERGCLVGEISSDPADCRRDVYARMSRHGDFIFNVGHYLRDGRLGRKSRGDRPLHRSEISFRRPFEHGLTTDAELQGSYTRLSFTHSLPPDVLSFDDFLAKLSIEEKSKMRDLPFAQQVALEKLLPMDIIGRDPVDGLPIFNAPSIATGRKYTANDGTTYEVDAIITRRLRRLDIVVDEKQRGVPGLSMPQRAKDERSILRKHARESTTFTSAAPIGRNDAHANPEHLMQSTDDGRDSSAQTSVSPEIPANTGSSGTLATTERPQDTLRPSHKRRVDDTDFDLPSDTGSTDDHWDHKRMKFSATADAGDTQAEGGHGHSTSI